MYLGFVSGILAGLLVVVIGTVQKRRKGGAPDTDERSELINVRAGFLTAAATGIISFVAWVTDNVLRNQRGEEVAFFSPWGIIVLATCFIFLGAKAYETWKVSDHDAAPDDEEMKKVKTALLCLAFSVLSLGSALASADGRIERSVANVLVGFLAVLGSATVLTLVRMYLRRQKATSGR
jgi:hypothetical protein